MAREMSVRALFGAGDLARGTFNAGQKQAVDKTVGSDGFQTSGVDENNNVVITWHKGSNHASYAGGAVLVASFERTIRLAINVTFKTTIAELGSMAGIAGAVFMPISVGEGTLPKDMPALPHAYQDVGKEGFPKPWTPTVPDPATDFYRNESKFNYEGSDPGQPKIPLDGNKGLLLLFGGISAVEGYFILQDVPGYNTTGVYNYGIVPTVDNTRVYIGPQR